MKKIVSIGGGTGHYTLLSGLKKFARDKQIEINAVVSMADNGGSTGVLRDSYGVLPPGDLRQCLVALSFAEKDIRDLFTFRYNKGPFKGHSFGNIFLSTLEQSSGSLKEAIRQAGKILRVYGRVLPVTYDTMNLIVKLEDGTELFGERVLDNPNLLKGRRVRSVFSDRELNVNEEALRVVQEADYIIFAPGDIYGSLVPNLLLNDFSKEVLKSSAQKIYIAPLSNKKHITDGFSLQDYVDILERYIGHIDTIILNNANVPKKIEKTYKEQEGQGVFPEHNIAHEHEYIFGDLLLDSEKILRHDSEKLARLIFDIVIN